MPRTILFVPFEEKDQAKTLGAKWDPFKKTWYVPESLDIAPFKQWLDSAESTGPTLKSSHFYILDSSQVCWKCGEETAVTAILAPTGTQLLEDAGYWEEIDFHVILSYVTFLNRVAIDEITKSRPYFKYAFSSTIQGKYWANLCEHCSALQGDFHLHDEPDGAFGFIDENKAANIIAYYINLPLEADGDISIDEPLEFMDIH